MPGMRTLEYATPKPKHSSRHLLIRAAVVAAELLLIATILAMCTWFVTWR